MADYFPDGIIIEILQKLPPETLLRCIAVCKSWRSLITSSKFISSHLKSVTKTSTTLLLRHCIKNSERYDLYSESFVHCGTFQLPIKSMNSFFTIVGSCNGVLCLSDDRVYYMNTIALWNPSIRRSVFLPKPNIIYNSYGSFTQCLGFGFDPVNEDYKVVRITYVDLGIDPQIEVYKVSSGVWEDLSYLGLEYVVRNRSRNVCLNGVVHWIGSDQDSNDLVVSFDLSHDVFTTMMLPFRRKDNDNNSWSHDLVLFKGCLALVEWKVSSTERLLTVFVMEEYGVVDSWTKTFCLGFGGGFLRPLWVREEGGVVFVWKDGCLVCYDQERGEVVDLGVGGSKSESYRSSLHVESFVSSLVLLGKGSSFSGGGGLGTPAIGDGGSSSGSDGEDGGGSVCVHDFEVCLR